MITMGALVLICLACAQPKEATVARQPAVAGQFYPGDAKTLTAMVDSMLADAEVPAISGTLVGIQVPHAGYPFSGPTAARAFKLLQGMDSVTVVMLGTSHRVMLDKAAVYARGSWHTPLGDVAIDEALAKAILAQDKFLADMPGAHAQEHSIEVEVPFLQRVLGELPSSARRSATQSQELQRGRRSCWSPPPTCTTESRTMTPIGLTVLPSD